MVTAVPTTVIATRTAASAAVEGHIVIHAVATVLGAREAPRRTVVNQGKQTVTVTKPWSVVDSAKTVWGVEVQNNNQSCVG